MYDTKANNVTDTIRTNRNVGVRRQQQQRLIESNLMYDQLIWIFKMDNFHIRYTYRGKSNGCVFLKDKILRLDIQVEESQVSQMNSGNL